MKNLFCAPILSLDELSLKRNELDKVVLIGGAFDVIHEGHISHLQKAKSLGNNLLVHITSDKRIREKKGPLRPIFKEAKRAKVISAMRPVDYIFVYNGRHYDREVIDKLNPDILFFNQEAFTDEIKERVKKSNFKGRVVVSIQEKLDSTSRAVKSLNRSKERKA